MAMAPEPMGSNGNMNQGDMSMAMHTSLYWGKDVTILFAGWPERNAGMYALAFLFVLLLGVTVEVLSVLANAKVGTNPKLAALIQACVHTIRMAFAYMVMLAVMSYNLGIFIAALAGHGIGFLPPIMLCLISGMSMLSFLFVLKKRLGLRVRL